MYFRVKSEFVLRDCSVREGVPGAEAARRGLRSAVRDEGAEEGDDRAEAEDDGAHQDGTVRAADHPPVALPRHHALRIPDHHQATPRAG